MRFSTVLADVAASSPARAAAGVIRAEGEKTLPGGLNRPTLAPEVLFHLGPIPVTNSMIMTVIVVALLALGTFLLSRNMKLIPTGKQNLLEAVIEFLVGFVEQTAGRRVGRVILPLIGTLFLYIITANWISLVPGVGTLLWRGPEGEVPLLRAPNADYNMTLAMALLTIVIVQVAGIVSHGVGGHFKEYRNPLNIIDELARIISLSVRLFANVFGGEVLLTLMLGLSLVVFKFILPVVLPVIFLGLELFVGMIQALVFALLAMSYITIAVAGHGGDSGTHEVATATAEHAV